MDLLELQRRNEQKQSKKNQRRASHEQGRAREEGGRFTHHHRQGRARQELPYGDQAKDYPGARI